MDSEFEKFIIRKKNCWDHGNYKVFDDDGEEVEDEFFSITSHDEDFDCPRWFEAASSFHVMVKLVASLSEKLKSSEAEVEALKAELAAKKTG